MNMNVSPQEELEELPAPAWELKKLTEKHKTVAALLAQGLGRGEVAAAAGFTPEYINMLARQPLFIAYVQEMTAVATLQLEAMFVKTVDVIGDTLTSGNADEKLKAAKLQMEATGRIGRNAEGLLPVAHADRLVHLSERLVDLLKTTRRRVQDVEDAQVL